MSEPLETMKVIEKESGQECIINVVDFDAEKYEPVVDEPEMEDKAE